MSGYIKVKSHCYEQYLILQVNLDTTECLIFEINGDKSLYNWLLEKSEVVTYEDLISNTRGYYSKSVNNLFVLHRL